MGDICIIEEYQVLEEIRKTNFKSLMRKFLYGCKLFPHCELTINEKNKKIVHNCLKDLMSDSHNFLVENNIRYIISDGTLLGAYRDGDFIDDDDDIDIRVDKYDWDRCVKLLSNLSDKYSIHKKHDKWYQVLCNIKTPGDPIQLDLASSDLVLEHGDWIDVDYLFDKQLDLIRIGDMEVYGPNKSDIVPYLEKLYGKSWNVKMCYNAKYKKYIILLNVILLLLVGLFIFLSVRRSKFFIIPAVILFVLAIISLINN